MDTFFPGNTWNLSDQQQQWGYIYRAGRPYALLHNIPPFPFPRNTPFSPFFFIIPPPVVWLMYFYASEGMPTTTTAYRPVLLINFFFLERLKTQAFLFIINPLKVSFVFCAKKGNRRRMNFLVGSIDHRHAIQFFSLRNSYHLLIALEELVAGKPVTKYLLLVKKWK